jgi:hypothetical protein
MYNNQFFNQRAYQPMYQPQYQPQQFQPVQFQGIQGRIVDNIDVVKATEISLDGSVSYFPIADGSAIVTKQLQTDGTSKLMVYKPVITETPKNITNEEFEKEISKLREEIEKINKRLGDGRYDQSQAISFKYDTNEYQSNG